MNPQTRQPTAGPFDALVRSLLVTDEGYSRRTEGAYIPAARTGLILALGSLVEASLGAALGGEQVQGRTKLPLPTIRFLQQLSQADPDGRFAPVADYLEAAILGGRVAADTADNKVPVEYFFEADQAGRLPLFVTSSMVTELAPILILLRRARSAYFVIEEPEAHLHLSAQRDMARAIVRLVNLGATVVVTTHSDTFLQQLNLSIAMGAQPETLAALRVQHGYADPDILAPGSARCFEFVAGEDGTIIREAPLTDEGFVVRSINEPLMRLTEEVIAVQAAEAEA